MEQGTLKQALSYDPASGVMRWLEPPKNHSGKCGEIAGCAVMAGSGKSYWVIGLLGKKYKRSRLAFLWVEGRWPQPMIDHADGDSLNDRWLNLREASTIQNAQNHKARKKVSPLPMGVRALRSGRFAARITVNKKTVYLGSFDCPLEAATIYQQARSTNYGRFA